MALLFLLPVKTDLKAGDKPKGDDKPAEPTSASKISQEWLYPGAEDWNRGPYAVSGPVDPKQKNLDLTSMRFAKTKASFEDVWNYYAGKCGFEKKWKKNFRHWVIDQAGDKRHRMVMDRGPDETHFGLFTEQYVIHVEVRQPDADKIEIRILTTMK
jgi:hypothetical protein